MNELINVNNTEIAVKEYNGQRVVTFKDVDAAHGRPEGTARKRFNENRERFVEGEDFYKICASVFRTRWDELPAKATEDVTLITETGYLMLVKSFRDDLAWEVQRKLVNGYFRAKEAAKPMSPNEMFLLQAQVNMENERQIREQERRLSALETDVSAVKETFSQAMNTLAQPAASPEVWQREMENTIRSMCAANGLNFHTWRAESYKELEQRAGVDLTRRQENRRKRMKQGGATYKERQGVSKLSIIADDRALRELYTSIVRRAEARNIVGKM